MDLFKRAISVVQSELLKIKVAYLKLEKLKSVRAKVYIFHSLVIQGQQRVVKIFVYAHILLNKAWFSLVQQES